MSQWRSLLIHKWKIGQLCSEFDLLVFCFLLVNRIMADKALEDRLKDELIEFIEQEEAVMSFPPSLSSAERRIVHQVRLVLVC